MEFGTEHLTLLLTVSGFAYHTIIHTLPPVYMYNITTISIKVVNIITNHQLLNVYRYCHKLNITIHRPTWHIISAYIITAESLCQEGVPVVNRVEISR